MDSQISMASEGGFVTMVQSTMVIASLQIYQLLSF